MEKLRTRIGQLFVLGFPGESPPKPFLDFLGEEQIGGVILFEENCPSHERAKASIELIESRIRDAAPLIAIDQEGGRISRLRGAPIEFKAAAEYGREGKVDHFREDYARSVLMMKSLGINLNLAPVADLWVNERNECLRDRTFGDDPALVSEFIAASIKTTHRYGMLNCLKHFPGLGAADIDPHSKTVKTIYDRIVWQQRDRAPFAAGVDAGADLIMTTHLISPSLDEEIATESSKIVEGLIREGLGFDGPVITDDLTMGGAEPLGSYGERAVKAFLAGHDLLMFCHDFDATVEAFEYFVGAIESGEIPSERVENALERVAGVKLRLRHPVTG